MISRYLLNIPHQNVSEHNCYQEMLVKLATQKVSKCTASLQIRVISSDIYYKLKKHLHKESSIFSGLYRPEKETV